jgi:hypothetical protein
MFVNCSYTYSLSCITSQTVVTHILCPASRHMWFLSCITSHIFVVLHHVTRDFCPASRHMWFLSCITSHVIFVLHHVTHVFCPASRHMWFFVLHHVTHIFCPASRHTLYFVLHHVIRGYLCQIKDLHWKCHNFLPWLWDCVYNVYNIF